MKILLLGDSSMAIYEVGRYPQVGWGQVFPRYIRKDIEVINFGKYAASTKSFIEDGSFKKVLKYIDANDYVFIQFGHNDLKSETHRETEAYSSYQYNLSFMINEIRRLGAVPVLLTSITRRIFNEFGELEKNIHKDFPNAMIDLGMLEQVATLDVFQKSWESLKQIGPNYSRSLFMNLKKNQYPNYPLGLNDNAHLTYSGAVWISEIVIEALKDQNLLVEYIDY